MKGHYLEGVGCISFSEFSPGELAQATGLGVDMQRVWRKRGHLPTNSGSRAAFSCQAVLEIAIRYELSRLGVSPSLTEGAAKLGMPTLMLATYFNERGPLVITGKDGDTESYNRKIDRICRFFEKITGGNFEDRFLFASKAPNFSICSNIEEKFKDKESVGAVILDLHSLANVLVRTSAKRFVVVTPK